MFSRLCVLSTICLVVTMSRNQRPWAEVCVVQSAVLFANRVELVASRWLPDHEAVESTWDSMVDNAYVYGRDWISQQVRTCLPLSK